MAGPAAMDRRRPDFWQEVSVLVLSRQRDEAIVIPECDIEIVVVQIKGDKVRLGITAPDHIQIYREEIWQEVLNEKASQRRPNDGAED